MTEPATMKLWGRQSSCNLQKALWALKELEVPFRRIDAGGDFGGLDEPGYRAMNPHGRVPTLADGEIVVWESEAIVRYLAARYGSGPLWAEDPAERAVADQWMAWTAAGLYPHWIRLFWRLVRTSEEQRDADAISGHCRAPLAAHRSLDSHLDGRATWLARASAWPICPRA